ncbi:MAG: TonB-dependent receptor, partial [Alphaproteobacteria bacterium]|nr:TonB-dependent receptor [Alphaproteobacteria bacterium]
TALTGKLAAEYALGTDAHAYLSYARGYKPTGLNFNISSPIVPTNFKKETVDALELGEKVDFLDHKLRLNAAGYYTWYRNFQFIAEDATPNNGGTANIPNAHIYGLELEATALPTRHWRIDANLALGAGKFTGNYYTIDAQTANAIRAQTYANLGYPPAYYYDPRIIAAVAAGLQNTNGNAIPKLPGVQGAVSSSFTFGALGGDWKLHGQVRYRGSFNYRIFDAYALDHVPAYTVVDAGVDYAPHGTPVTLSLNATNLFNTLGINSRFSDPYGSNTTSVEYIDPRQVIARVAVKF